MSHGTHFAPPGPLGFGGAPSGNMFEEVADEAAEATLAAAWDAGIRYFDTAPEIRARHFRAPLRPCAAELPAR